MSFNFYVPVLRFFNKILELLTVAESSINITNEVVVEEPSAAETITCEFMSGKKPVISLLKRNSAGEWIPLSDGDGIGVSFLLDHLWCS